MRFRSVFLFGFSLLPWIGSAHADCANPSGVKGAQIYDETTKAVRVCDGETWHAAGDLARLPGQIMNPIPLEDVIPCEADAPRTVYTLKVPARKYDIQLAILCEKGRLTAFTPLDQEGAPP